MTTKNAFSPIFDLIGQTVTDIRVNWDLLIFCFGEYVLHANCFTRVICNQKILLTTMDYQSWDEENYTHNDMYLNIADWGEKIIGQQVKNITISPVYDFVVTLNNDVRIEIYNSDGNHRMCEEPMQWCFFKPEDKSYGMLCVWSNRVEHTQCEP